MRKRRKRPESKSGQIRGWLAKGKVTTAMVAERLKMEPGRASAFLCQLVRRGEAVKLYSAPLGSGESSVWGQAHD